MKIASLSLLALSSLVDRTVSQSFVCDLCPGDSNGDVINPGGIVEIPFRDATTCMELETSANAFEISPAQCAGIGLYANICCFPDESTPEPSSSPSANRGPTAAPTGKPTAAPTDSIAPTFTSAPTGAPTARPTFSPGPDCYDDLNEIAARESNVYDSTFYREYILCPNTEFVVGMQSDEGVFEGGSYPIFPRRNVGYKCGEDGKSTNNCQIIGGQFQLISFNGQWELTQHEAHTNVTVSGITFVAGGWATVLAGNPGDITFTDCIFYKQNTIASIFSLYDVRQGRRRSLGEKVGQHSLITTLLAGGDYNQWKKENERTIEEQDQLNRDLQIENPDEVVTSDVIIINCVFEDNTVSRPSISSQSAVISNVYPENFYHIYNTTFVNNNYKMPRVQGIGSMIESVAPITVENCCFLDNDLLRYGSVVMKNAGAVLTSSGNYGNVLDDKDVACEFAISFQNQDDFEKLENYDCLKFDAPADFDPSTCVTRPTRAPSLTTEPTMAPTRTFRFDPVTTRPTQTSQLGTTDAPTAGAAGRVAQSLSAAAAALTVYFVY